MMSEYKVTSLRFDKEQYHEVHELAAFYGVSVTRFMREAVLEKVEDDKDYNEAIERLRDKDKTIVSRAEILNELGLANEQ